MQVQPAALETHIFCPSSWETVSKTDKKNSYRPWRLRRITEKGYGRAAGLPNNLANQWGYLTLGYKKAASPLSCSTVKTISYICVV